MAGSDLLDLEGMPEEAREEIGGVMESVYMGWVDQKVPVLDHQKPRELVKFPDGRRKVAAMINDFENREARHPNPQFQFDYNKLRKELGLQME